MRGGNGCGNASSPLIMTAVKLSPPPSLPSFLFNLPPTDVAITASYKGRRAVSTLPSSSLPSPPPPLSLAETSPPPLLPLLLA